MLTFDWLEIYTSDLWLIKVCEIVEAMRADTDTTPSRILVDGGMTQSDLLLQLQSNLLGVEVHKPSIKEVHNH